MELKRKPTTPGEILNEEFLKPLQLTQKQLAEHLKCDIKVINRIINGRTSVTADMAVKLGYAFQVSPEFWLNAQRAIDLYDANRNITKRERPRPIKSRKTNEHSRKANYPSHHSNYPSR